MTGISKQDTMRLLHVDSALLERMQKMQRSGEPIEQILEMLRGQGVPKAGASIALRLAEIASLQHARSLVDESRAYLTWPEEEQSSAMQELSLPVRAEEPTKAAA